MLQIIIVIVAVARRSIETFPSFVVILLLTNPLCFVLPWLSPSFLPPLTLYPPLGCMVRAHCHVSTSRDLGLAGRREGRPIVAVAGSSSAEGTCEDREGRVYGAVGREAAGREERVRGRGRERERERTRVRDWVLLHLAVSDACGLSPHPTPTRRQTGSSKARGGSGGRGTGREGERERSTGIRMKKVSQYSQ